MHELSFPFLEVVGYSTTTLAEAISNALLLIDLSLHQPLWVEKAATKAVTGKDQLIGWQVVLRIGFAEEPAWLTDADLLVPAEDPPGTLINR